MEIIVISIAQYKEKDAVISAISQNEFITFYAKGVFSRTNKNSFLTCLLVKANITLIEGKIKYPILETAELISSPSKLSAPLEYMTVLLSINESMLHLVEEQERYLLYNVLDKSLASLKAGVSPYHVALYYFLKTLPVLGFEIQTNHCVECGSKSNIVDFSFIEGGFICKQCQFEDVRRYTNNQLILIRNAICCSSPSEISNMDVEDSKFILKNLNDFITEGTGYRVKTLDTLLK